MSGARSIKRHQTQTYRTRVLSVVDASEVFLTGQQVAQCAELSHKQAIDALNALNNLGKVARVGRKSTARWCRVLPPTDSEHPALVLERAFMGFFK